MRRTQNKSSATLPHFKVPFQKPFQIRSKRFLRINLGQGDMIVYTQHDKKLRCCFEQKSFLDSRDTVQARVQRGQQRTKDFSLEFLCLGSTVDGDLVQVKPTFNPRANERQKFP